jgi:glutathione S-transferase
MTHPHEPYKVFLADVSYFSGKLETYLRYKEIPYLREEMTSSSGAKEVYANTGLRKVPAVKTADGLWLADSTPMIDWFENQYPEHPVIPADPALGFLSKLVEDYADEWCWRAAMYHRWRTAENANFLGARIGAEVVNDWPLPTRWAGELFKLRQRKIFMWGDGLRPETEQAISGQYPMLCKSFSRLLEDQEYLLGDQPSLVDFAFMGPFFRHYFCDPVPAKLMRDEYPAVLEWVARTWNARASRSTAMARHTSFTHPGWTPILEEIATEYLPYLAANAAAVAAEQKHFDFISPRAPYRKLPAIRYRAYCREMLERQYQGLDNDTRLQVDALFSMPLQLNSQTDSGLIETQRLPLAPRPSVSRWQQFKIFLLGTPWDRPE